MFCAQCGLENHDNAWKCVRCGTTLPRPEEQGGALQQAPPGEGAPSIPSYLPQAVLTTLFCCLPFGIVAIIYAAQVGSRASSGDIQGAMDASGKAKMWCWISFGFGLPIVLLGIIGQLATLSK